MHRLSASQLEPGLLVGRNLYNDRGDILLARGTRLDDTYIEAIRQRGYRFIYVLDGIADDVEPLGLISQRLRSGTVRNLNSMFELMAQATRSGRDAAPTEGVQALTEIVPKFNSAIERQIVRLESDVEHLLGEVLDAQIFEGVAALKSHDNYAFEHSVDVAFYGVMLGRKLALDYEYLRDLALGCLLHDIGKMYVDDVVLTKPGTLTPVEFKQVMRHTVLGYQLMRQMPISSPAAGARGAAASRAPGRQRLSEWAHGLEPLVSDAARAVRPAAHDIARGACGGGRCVFGAVFGSTVSRRAAGAGRAGNDARDGRGPPESGGRGGVRVDGRGVPGRRARAVWRWAVHRVLRDRRGVTAGAPNRPVVRLLFDAQGLPVPEGVEVDLRKESDRVALIAVPEAGVSVEEYARRVALARSA